MKETYTTGNSILINQDSATRIGCLVSKTGVTANSDGDYIVKAGTPLYGSDAGMNRQTALTVAATGATGSETTAQGVLYEDVVFESGASTANGTLVIEGTVDYLKLDSGTQALITTAVKTALKGSVHFVKGRAD